MVPSKFTSDFCHEWFTLNIFDWHGFADEGLCDVWGNVCFYIQMCNFCMTGSEGSVSQTEQWDSSRDEQHGRVSTVSNQEAPVALEGEAYLL